MNIKILVFVSQKYLNAKKSQLGFSLVNLTHQSHHSNVLHTSTGHMGT